MRLFKEYKEPIIFLLFYIGAVIIYTSMYATTMGRFPIYSDDSILGLLNENPKIVNLSNGTILDDKGVRGVNSNLANYPVLSYLTESGYKIPILLQDRHTGLSLILVKLLYEKLDINPISILLLYNYFISLLFLFLCGYYFYRKFGLKMSMVGLSIFSIDAFLIIGHYTLISEQLNRLFIIIVFILMLEKKNINIILIGFILGLGIVNKLTFLFPSIAILSYLFISLDKKQFIKLVGVVVATNIPYLLIIDFNRFFYEVSPMVSTTKPIIQNSFRDLLLIFGNRQQFFDLFYNEKVLTSELPIFSGTDSAFAIVSIGVLFYILYKGISATDKKLLIIIPVYGLSIYLLGSGLSIKTYYYIDLGILVTMS